MVSVDQNVLVVVTGASPSLAGGALSTGTTCCTYLPSTMVPAAVLQMPSPSGFWFAKPPTYCVPSVRDQEPFTIWPFCQSPS